MFFSWDFPQSLPQNRVEYVKRFFFTVVATEYEARLEMLQMKVTKIG
jgi:hypothetical protein